MNVWIETYRATIADTNTIRTSMTQQVKNEILTLLFDAYRRYPSDVVDISQVAARHGIEVRTLYEELYNARYIRREMVSGPGGTIHCTISLFGISQVDPLFLVRKYNQILLGLHQQGGSGNIPEILGIQPLHYQMALELTDELKQMGLIDVGGASFADNVLFAVLTPKGRTIAQQGGL